MNKPNPISLTKTYGIKELDTLLIKLKSTSDPRRRYEYVLWLGKKLPVLSSEFHVDSNRVKGCISEVYVLGELINGRIKWSGYSDALITKGLLALLIQGLNNLTPEEVLSIDESFIQETGLKNSLTPSRSNGFLNILLKMKTQAKVLSLTISNSIK